MRLTREASGWISRSPTVGAGPPLSEWEADRPQRQDLHQEAIDRKMDLSHR